MCHGFYFNNSARLQLNQTFGPRVAEIKTSNMELGRIYSFLDATKEIS